MQRRALIEMNGVNDHRPVFKVRSTKSCTALIAYATVAEMQKVPEGPGTPISPNMHEK